MVVQLSSVDPLKIKAAAGKYAYSSRIKWLHIDDKTRVGHFESIREELRYYNRQLDCQAYPLNSGNYNMRTLVITMLTYYRNRNKNYV